MRGDQSVPGGQCVRGGGRFLKVAVGLSVLALGVVPCPVQAGEWATVVVPTDPKSTSQQPTTPPIVSHPSVHGWLWQFLHPKPGGPPRRESSIGTTYSPGAISLYSTLTWAPFSSITADRWRLRSSVAASRYAYDGTWTIGTHQLPVRYRGYGTTGDLLIGYQMTQGPATIKLFLGGVADMGRTTPLDEAATALGLAYGVKATVETWTNLSAESFLAANVAWASAHSLHSADGRLGYRVTPNWSTGLEGGWAANSDGASARAGAFLRYEWQGGEVSASGGRQADGAGTNATYVTANFLLRN